MCVDVKVFKVGDGIEFCINRLKICLFMVWLWCEVFMKDCVVYYGFDENECYCI